MGGDKNNAKKKKKVVSSILTYVKPKRHARRMWHEGTQCCIMGVQECVY